MGLGRDLRIGLRVDIKGPRVVKCVQLEGIRPLSTVANFLQQANLDGFDEICLVDTVASLYDREPGYDVISQFASAVTVPLTVIGGINNIEVAHKVFESGADRVGCCTAIFLNADLLGQISSCYGAQALVPSLELKCINHPNREYQCTYLGGRELSKFTLMECLRHLSLHCSYGEILITSVDAEGTGKGLDMNILDKYPAESSHRVILSGGIGKISDFGVLADSPIVSSVLCSQLFNVSKVDIQSAKDFISKNSARCLRNL